MNIIRAGALVASLVASAPVLAQTADQAAPGQRSFSRAIPPEAMAAKASPAALVQNRVKADAKPALVSPQTMMPRPVRAVVTPETVIPRPFHAVVAPLTAMPRPSRAVAMSDDAPAEAVPAVAFRDLVEEREVEAPRARPAVVRATAQPASLDSSTKCVAMAIYHEARGEPIRGQRAVADVVMNRARSGRWGSNACSVVNAPSQFSNRWSWRSPVQGVAAWDRALEIARDAVSGAVGVSSRLMNFRAASMGAGSRSFMRLGNHVFW